jgi:uncharacterized protein (TIGR01777 family)
MEIAISGANGYIARNIINRLTELGHKIRPIERGRLYHPELLTELISGSDVVINLAGAPIFQRWTRKSKDEIFRSRIESTRNIVNCINELADHLKPALFISASAVGLYEPNINHDETSQRFANDFTGEVVKAWENSSSDLSPKVRKVIFRIGLVLGKEAKTIANLLPLFKLGLGGKIGSGSQPFPFIHLADVVNVMKWAIDNENSNGIYNLVAPEDINNQTFTNSLAKQLHRKAIFTVPKVGLKLLYGEAASLLLESPQVYPERLLKEGYRFLYPNIESSLKEIVKS